MRRGRLRLRDRAALLLLAAAVVIGGLVTLVVVLEQLDHDDVQQAERARMAQLDLERFQLALAEERISLGSYVSVHDPSWLTTYHDDRAAAARARSQLVAAASRDGFDTGPLTRDAQAWQDAADAVAALPPSRLTPHSLDSVRRLYVQLTESAQELYAKLDTAATRSVVQANGRAAFVAVATPVTGLLLMALLIVVGWLVLSAILHPVDELAGAARRISRSIAADSEEPAVDIPGLQRRDELGQLAHALDAWQQESGRRLALARAMTAEKDAQARSLERLNEAAATISGILEPVRLGNAILEEARSLLATAGADAVLAWYSPERDLFSVFSREVPDPNPRDLSIEEGLLGEAFRTGQTRLIEDYSTWPGASQRALRRNVQSMAAVPLSLGDRRIGVLAAFTRDGLRLEVGDVQVLSLLASQAAPALEAARLHSQLLQAHATLIRTNEELATASRHKSDFLAAMSHELRTPLNAIMGFSELLLDYGDRAIDPAKRNSYLHHIHTSGQHLLDLINHLLDLAKVEAGRMELRRAELDLAASVAAAVATVEPLAARAGVELRSTVCGPLPLLADDEKVRRILLNLLSNAIKFTPRGGSVTVEAARQRPGHVLLSVIDTGIGIAKEDQERIFEEFEQLQSDGPAQGTGLGLTLTRRLAELHGGRVWVESTLGQGSRFFVELPTGAAGEQLVDTIQPERGGLILVVEDDPAAAALLVETLRRGGYRTEVVPEGTRAVEEAARLHPVAITLDLMLPDVDGWEVLRAIKSSERTRGIPVVIVSVVDERPRGIALGADDYLVKPVERDALLAAIERFHHAGGAPGTVRVLAIDDEPAVLERLAAQLEPGFVVLSAGSGKEGIELARRARPDIVLLDMVMPDLTGFDVLAALEDDPLTRAIPILVMTSSELAEVDRERLNGRAEAVLSKGPDGGDQLLGHLRRLGERPAPVAPVEPVESG